MDPLITLKTLLKKYLPNHIYRFVYAAYIYIKSVGSRNTEDIVLAKFTKPEFKKVSVGGVEFDINLDPNNGCVDKEIYKHGVWEKDMLLEIQKHISKTSVCLDVGANIGQHTLFMSRISPKGTIYAFEPVTSLFNQINTSIGRNGITNVVVNKFGLSNKNSTQKIYLDNLNMGKTSFEKNVNTSSSTEEASMLIFDDWWKNKAAVDFVKIDVEGYEYYALLGMQRMLESNHPTIILEYSPHFYRKMDFELDAIPKFLFNLGYSLYDLENNKEEVTIETLPQFIQNVQVQTNILCIKM